MSDSQPLVRDGVACADIVLAADAPEPLRHAARLLQEDLHRVTGVEFAVATPETAAGSVRIAIGGDGDLPFERIRDDGYLIWTVDSTIHLAGLGTYGTVNAVVSFIRDALGVHHYFPGPLFTHCASKGLTEVPALRLLSNPAFPTRAYGLANPLAKEWCVLNRVFNKPDPRPFIAASHHNIGNIFMREDLLRDHPEYYALRNGERDLPVRTGGEQYAHLLLAFIAQPCFSHPGVIEEATRAARAFFDENPDRHTFSLGVNDTEKYCECDACTAINAIGAEDGPRLTSNRRRYMLEHGHNAGRHSNVYFHFVNEVAKRLKQTHPDKFLGCLAYESVEEPPTNIDRLEDNVCICLTQDSSQYFDPEYRQRDLEIVHAWLTKCAHVMKYDYYGLMWYYPRVFASFVDADIKNSARLGLVGMYSEVHPIWAFTGPMLYMGARLLWDPTLDGRVLLDTCYRDLFGDAAADIAAFYGLYERLWKKPRPGEWFQGLLFPPQPKQFECEEVEEAHALLGAALQRPLSIVQRERVLHLLRFHEVPLHIARAFDEARRADEAPDSPAALAAASRAMHALTGLDKARTGILEDPAAEAALWTGFRYEAVERFVTWNVRNSILRALQARLPSLPDDPIRTLEAQMENLPVRRYLQLEILTANGAARACTLQLDTWRAERAPTQPSAPPMEISPLPDSGLRLKGAGTVTLATELEVTPGSSCAFVLPVQTDGVSLLTELMLGVSWLDAHDRELGALVDHYPDTKGAFELAAIGDAPAGASRARLKITMKSVLRDEAFVLAPLRFTTADVRSETEAGRCPR